MKETISAEANEISVESAETLPKPQLVDADTTKTSVDSGEPIEQSSEAPDIMELLLGDEADELVDTSKTVPEGQFLKLKSKLTSVKQELELARSQMAQPPPAQVQPAQAPLQTVAPAPDPTKFDEGVYDPAYQTELVRYQATEIKRIVQDQLVQTNNDIASEAYLSKYKERLDRTLPAANQRIEALKKVDSEFKQRFESPNFQQAISKLSAEALTAITESNNPESILNYYTHKPERLVDLVKNSMDELLNLGMLIGKVNGVKGTRTSVTKPIKPLKSGDNTNKLHPFRDHAKYDHTTKEGHAKWERDVEKLNTRS